MQLSRMRRAITSRTFLFDDKTFKAQQNRSQIVGNNINQPDGAKLSMAELMKLKNQNPDMDITPYLKTGKEK